MKFNQVKFLILLMVAQSGCLLHLPCALAQCTFSSGSTGADGMFDPTNSMPNTGWSFSNNVVTVTNKANGIFNFTSINISNIWTVKFTKNTLNTPVYLLAQSNVTIRGTIDVSGTRSVTTSAEGGTGGPGGFDGGKAALPNGSTGFGPGGSYLANAGHALKGADGYGPGGAAYGVIDIQTMIGGSGGGGNNNVCNACGGGGGGGALLIAASGTLTCDGTLNANGGAGFGRASGGAIRLAGNIIQGEGIIQAVPYDNSASIGRVRLDACLNRRVSLTDPPATLGIPTAVFLTTNPTIKVTSIAGVNISWPPAGSLANPDTNLPSAFTNPAVISVSASNITVGTAFKVIVTPAYGTNMIGSNTLAGTYAFSSGIVTMAVYTDRVWRVNALIDYIPRP